MKNASDIVSALSAKKIATAVGVRHESAVYNAASDGRFPASWFDAVEKECVKVGIECPRTLFRFKRHTSSDAGQTQGAA